MRKDPLFWLSFLLGGFFLSLTLWFSLGMDQALYSYIAWAWKEHHLVPYLGVWEHNFPGIFLVHRLEIALFGESILGFRVFDFLIQLSGLPMIFYLTKRLSGLSVSGFLASVFYGIYYFSLGNSGAAQRETFIFWIFLLCLVLAFSGRKMTGLKAIIIGLLLGFVFLLKPFYGLSWPVFGALILAGSTNRGWKQSWQKLSGFSISCLLPALVFVCVYWRMRGLEHLYQEVIWYNAKIYGKMTDPKIQWLYFFIQDLPSFAFRGQPLVFFSALFAIGRRFKNQGLVKDQSLFWILLSLMIACIMVYAFQAKFFPYQMAPFVGLMIIFSGWGFGQLFSMLKDLAKSGPGKTALRLAVLGVIILMIANIDPWLRDFALSYCFRDPGQAYSAGAGTEHDTQLSANYFQVARFLKPVIKPGDEIACFGPYPLIPFLLKAKLPTTFPCVQYLLRMRKDGRIPDLQQKWIDEYSSQTIAARPRFFIISDSFPGQNNAFFNYSNRNLGKALDQQFPDLKYFITKNYKVYAVIGHTTIYELIK